MEELADGLIRIQKMDKSGWCWNMFLVRMRDGSWLIHSPTWVGEDTMRRVQSVGRIGYLFAPNSYHYVHIRRFREAIPNVVTVSSAAAMPRLVSKGVENLQSIDTLAEEIPEGSRWVACEHVKNGEAWLELGTEHGKTLLACDAFMNIDHTVSGFMGFMLRRLNVVPSVRVAKTWRWLVTRNNADWTRWATAALEQIRPKRVLVSHGDPIVSENLTAELVAVMQRDLG